MTQLTAKQQAFVREYMVDFNATQAAIRAGYSEKTAHVIAAQLMAKPHIAAEIKVAQGERADRLDVSVDRIEQELAKIGWFNIKDHVSILAGGDPYAAIQALPDSVAAAIAGIDVHTYMDGEREVRRLQLKFFDKRAALVDLGRRHGMFVDRHEVVDKTPRETTSKDLARAWLHIYHRTIVRMQAGDQEARAALMVAAQSLIETIRQADEEAAARGKKGHDDGEDQAA